MGSEMTAAPTHIYDAKVLSVHDGDTCTVSVDCGFRVTYTTPIRLNGINAPELNTPTGPTSREHLITLINNQPIVLHTYKDPTDKYGRWLADVLTIGGVNLCEQMVTDGFAVAWNGRGPKPS